MSRRLAAFSFACGLIFAAGLVIAGMTTPSKVIGFLDLFGRWDPSLAFVMVGAIGVHLVLFRVIRRRTTPLCEMRFFIPTRRDLDARLFLGAALFGVGWGLGGICPGPSVVALASGAVPFVVFFGAMVGGMLLFRVFESVERSSPGKESR